MNNVIYVTTMVVLWIVNLFNGTGLGQVYQTTEKARIIVDIIFIITIIFNYKRQNRYVNRQDFIIFGCTSLLFIFDTYIHGYGLKGMNYFYVFILIYILSKMPVREKYIRKIGIIYLLMGIIVIYVYDYGTIFSGWNPNTIGMIALYSYLIFMIPFYNKKNKIGTNIILIAITVIYIILIEPTNSRSSTLFAIIAILLALSIIPKSIIIRNGKQYFVLLLIPLIIAIIVVYLSKGSYIDSLNAWSIQKFEKPIFNGRDTLWNEGFDIFFQNLLFGRGIIVGNWHNSLISILTAYGFFGLLLWILSLNNILSKGESWINDTIVQGCIISFFIMYIHQSVELGLVHESPNILPYIVLGMMLGRINFLKNEKSIKEMEE